MFSEISDEVTARITELRMLLQTLKDGEDERLGANVSVSFRGLFFVGLYGIVEYAVANGVAAIWTAINQACVPVSDVRPGVLGIGLHPECSSLRDVSPAKSWAVRKQMFAKSRSTETFATDPTVIPTDGKNIRYEQLEMIWETLELEVDILPEMRIRGYLNEIVENRNRIAHGSQSPAEVGRRYTPDDLQKRLSAVTSLCFHLLFAWEGYVIERRYSETPDAP